ncbi:translesion error-prone DNA polymerase V autoproteolytic subunit [Spirosoma harenae]
MTKIADNLDPIPPENIYKVDASRRTLIPLYGSSVQAGFASPAENYIEARLNLQDLCVGDVDMTHFVKATGESMIGDYIFPGSILVVDSTIEVITGKVIVASIDGDWCVKRFVDEGNTIKLESSNPRYQPIYIPKPHTLEVLGVVTYIVSKPPKYVRPS